MDSPDAVTILRGLLDLIRQDGENIGLLVEQGRAQRRRLEELEENVADLTLEVGRLNRRARLLVNMKAATLTSTCTTCGEEFASEAGPLLCGSCWIAAGRPGNGLHAV